MKTKIQTVWVLEGSMGQVCFIFITFCYNFGEGLVIKQKTDDFDHMKIKSSTLKNITSDIKSK